MPMKLGLGLGLGVGGNVSGSGIVGNFVATSAEVMANGRTVVVLFAANTPVNFGVPDWLPGKQLGGISCHLTGVGALSFDSCELLSNVPSFTGAQYTNATQTLTLAGAFTNYRAQQAGDQIGMIVANGQSFTGATWTDATKTLTGTGIGAGIAGGGTINVTAGTGATHGNFTVSSVTANTIVLTTSIGAGADGHNDIAFHYNLTGVSTNAFAINSRISNDAITIGNPALGADANPVVCLTMPPGQGTQLIWRAVFWVVNDSDIVDWSASGLTFTADAGLLQDVYANISAAVGGLAVTNNSRVDKATGFTTTTGFTSDQTVYIRPGAAGASDANTFVQMQDPTKGAATLNGACAAAFAANGATPKAVDYKILQGTVHTSTTSVKSPGISRLKPCIIESYWDNGASGVGTQGVRPQVNSTTTAINWGGGIGLTDAGQCVIRGIEIVGSNSAGQSLVVNSSFAYTPLIFDDCVIRNGSNGINVQSSFFGGMLFCDRYCFTRCIFKDIYSAVGGHTEGVFSYGVSNCVISQCAFDFTGRQLADGSGSDIFSRSMYLSSESECSIVVGAYISRSDGCQLRAGGGLTRSVLTQVQLAGFIDSAGGRMALTYNELGADFGVASTFTNATYTHSTRTLAGTGVGTGLTVPCTIWVASGTGVTAGQYRVATVTNANSIVLSGAGLGAGADGSANINGVPQNLGRGFGVQTNPGSDIQVGGPGALELNTMVYLNTYGSAPQGPQVPAKDARYPQQGPVIVRSNTIRQSGPIIIGGTGANTSPTRLDKSLNLVDNTGTTLTTESDQFAFASWAFLNADNNVFLSNASPSMSIGGVNKTLAQYQSATGQEAHSIASATPVYVNDGTDLSAWAVHTGIGTTGVDLRNALRNRALGVWGTAYDMTQCVLYMMGQYAVVSGLPAVGVAPLTYYGAGSVDPAVYV